MAVPSSGQLKLWNDIWNNEIGGTQGNNSLHSASVYAGFTTPDAMGDFYGWSDVEVPSVSTSAMSSVTDNSMQANGMYLVLGMKMYLEDFILELIQLLLLVILNTL